MVSHFGTGAVESSGNIDQQKGRNIVYGNSWHKSQLISKASEFRYSDADSITGPKFLVSILPDVFCKVGPRPSTNDQRHILRARQALGTSLRVVMGYG